MNLATINQRKQKLKLKHNLHRRLKRAKINYCIIHKIIFVPFPRKLKLSTNKAIGLLVRCFGYSVRVFSLKSKSFETNFCCKTSIRY